jgi:hypothetical protein
MVERALQMLCEGCDDELSKFGRFQETWSREITSAILSNKRGQSHAQLGPSHVVGMACDVPNIGAGTILFDSGPASLRISPQENLLHTLHTTRHT